MRPHQSIAPPTGRITLVVLAVVAAAMGFPWHSARERWVLGIAIAVVITLLARWRGLPVTMHTPSEVKAAITGDGRAQKAQVAAMVVRILKLTEAPKPVDATDALALAICHVWRGGAADRSAEAMQRQGVSPPSGNVPMHRERGRRKGGFR